MPKQTGKNFIFLECPLCHGSGRVQNEACRRCREYGSLAWLDGDILYWGKKIDSLHIFEEELERLVKGIINGFLIFFGLIGLAALFVTIIKATQDGALAWKFIFQRSQLLGIFSVTLLTDLYAYYRMQRESVLEKSVKPKSFDVLLTEESPESLFEKALAMDKKKMSEISYTLTLDAKRAVEQAWQMSGKMKHAETKPIHLLAALLNNEQTRVVLFRLGIDVKELVAKITRNLSKLPAREKGDSLISSDFKKVLLRAYAEAFYARRQRVDIPQLLVAIIFVDDDSRDIFYDLEIELEQLVNVVEWLNIQHRLSVKWHNWRSKAIYKSKGPMNKSMTAQATPLLDRFSHDMTQLARQGVLAPCIGRDRELEEALRVLQGGKNVIFSGFPGVGKTSIIEGIAELMASEEVPEILQDKRLVSLSVASLVGAASHQGELEGVILQIINEIVRSGNIVVYIDNIQNMVGTSTGGSEKMDIAEILANALQKHLFYCVASTTPLDYRRYIEGSNALMSVFQKVNVEEPDTNGAIQILEGKAGGIEVKNQIYFSYESIEKTVKLSERYIHERYLPEKAISILEEVGVYVRKKKGKDAIVSGEDVAEVISSKTNVPVTKVTQKESERLLDLEEIIHKRMVNQEEAVRAVSTALRRARAELRDVRRPIVNLLFLGPTGVGKTELAKTVAEVYFGSEDDMIRLDMSEYQDKSSINRLIGAPPGYAGATSGGYLTEAIRTKPFALLLLDEIEKAHPDLLNIFLQVMDDGRLTDTLGRTIDFTNVILIATSNAGTSLIQQRIQENTPLEKIKEELINQALQPYFRPEFLNRFDHIVVFRPLSMEHIIQIVGLMLKQVASRLALKGIQLDATKEAMVELAQQGFDPIFGARPLRRAIQDRVDNALASYLLQGKLGRRDVAVLEPGGRISVRRAQPL
ncbi:MAG: ATP-dependent Clp protease ATP-binding subunit [Patescibacteria group bacterium]|jgi:ATP-dependent Clp protease ATP-binding subunit ClpC